MAADVDGGCGWAACCRAAGAGELESADFAERSRASEDCAFGVGSGSSSLGDCVTSSGETMSTAIISVVTEPNGCTSAKIRTTVKTDRWATADAAMPEPMNRRSSTVPDRRFDVAPGCQHSGQRAARFAFLGRGADFDRQDGGRSASIPFRRETEIGEPALGASHLGYLAHLVVGQREVKDVDVFRQPFDPRRPRYRGDILLHQPAQTDLCCGLAVGLPDPGQRLVVLDAPLRN